MMGEGKRTVNIVPFIAESGNRRVFFNISRFIARSALAKRLLPQNAVSHKMYVKGVVSPFQDTSSVLVSRVETTVARTESTCEGKRGF